MYTYNDKTIAQYEVDGIDTRDYPDFCDSYISWACYKDGTELTDTELEQLNEDSTLVHDMVYNYLF